MEKEESILRRFVSACGFFCGSCPDYRNEACPGCRDAHNMGDCHTLDCVTEKEIDFCTECGEFPCNTILEEQKVTVLDRSWLLWKREQKERRENTGKKPKTGKEGMNHGI